MMFTQTEKQRIVEMFRESGNNMAVGRAMGCSARTVGRILDEMEQFQKPAEVNVVVANEAVGQSSMVDETPEVEETVPHYRYKFVASTSVINVTRINVETGESNTVSSPNTSDLYSEAFEILKLDQSQAAVHRVYDLLDVQTRVKTMSFGNVVIDPERGVMLYRTEEGEGVFGEGLYSRVMRAVEEEEDTLDSLVNFANLLSENPSEYAVLELYDFLEAADIKITEQGMVECFKKVRSDFTDCFTGTFDNSVGAIPKVPRNTVDPDSDRTCSRGLHVCSKAYLRSFGGERIIRVLVHPRDFVSIPKDYYSLDNQGQVKAKARVCRYEVMQDLTFEMSEYI